MRDFRNRYICEGHEYRYRPDSRELIDNYGTVVATLQTDQFGEYMDVIIPVQPWHSDYGHVPEWVFESHHINSIPDDVGRFLTERYTVWGYDHD